MRCKKFYIALLCVCICDCIFCVSCCCFKFECVFVYVGVLGWVSICLCNFCFVWSWLCVSFCVQFFVYVDASVCLYVFSLLCSEISHNSVCLCVSRCYALLSLLYWMQIYEIEEGTWLKVIWIDNRHATKGFSHLCIHIL